MNKQARGNFEVKITPQKPDNAPAESSGLGRMSIAKHFQGDLDARSEGEMLAVRTEQGSAGYVALERVRGKLDGRSGSFVLQHTGIMTREAQSLSVTIVPDSGTDELVGLAGTMNIIITGGNHIYELAYTITAPR